MQQRAQTSTNLILIFRDLTHIPAFEVFKRSAWTMSHSCDCRIRMNYLQSEEPTHVAKPRSRPTTPRYAGASDATAWVRTEVSYGVEVLVGGSSHHSHTFEIEGRHYTLGRITGLKPGASHESTRSR